MLLLGTGAYGKVVLQKRGTDFSAVKSVKLYNSEGISVSTLREARLLRQLCHPHIVTLYDVSWRNDVAYMELEFLPLSLRHLIFEPLTLSATRAYARDILSALEFCHGQNVMHRDVKPENLLLARDGRLKLTDFGLARETLTTSEPLSQHKYTPQMVTLWYRAPEILVGEAYGPGVDVWSAACVIAEMLSAVPLFCAPTELGMLDAINTRHPGSMMADPACVAPFDDKMQALLMRCLAAPEKRVTAANALRTQWLVEEGLASTKRKREECLLDDGNRCEGDPVHKTQKTAQC